MDKKRILFICTHNSARSQMAEGLVNALYSDRFQAFSAGTEATAVQPAAVRVMAEIGIDISGHRSKGVDEFINQPFDYIVTVCDDARQACPFFPGGKEYRHAGFEDPVACRGTEQDVLACFRRSRDDIRRWVEETFGGRPGQPGGTD
jgi:arsenate reductase